MREHNLFLDDLFGEIPFFSDSRKKAIAFSIYSGMSMCKVVNLKWSDEITLNWRSKFILRDVTASNGINTDSVFQENLNGIFYAMQTLPMLVDIYIGQSGMSYLRVKYGKSIPIKINSLI